MDHIRIVGGQRLTGTIPISGAKNAALPLMIASLLTRETLTLHNVPRLADVSLLARILGNHGVDLTVAGKRPGQERASDGQTFRLTAAEIVDATAPYEMLARMRAGFWVLAPLVARYGRAKVSLPGGCAIGTRPVDLHIQTLEQLGADIELEGGYVIARAPRGLTGNKVTLSKVSVGATHTALMAAVLARGESLIENAAREPEVGDLANCLIRMGARIEGIGTPTLSVQGRETLYGADHTVLPDRIETGTYAMAAAITGGDVLLDGARPDLLLEALRTLRFDRGRGGVAGPYQGCAKRRWLAGGFGGNAALPGFPTDLQAQFIALMCKAKGTSAVRGPSSRTASCMCRNWRGSAPASNSRATRLSSRGSAGSRARRSWRRICGPRCRSSSPVSPPKGKRRSAGFTISTAVSSGSNTSSASAAPRSSGFRVSRLAASPSRA